MEGVSLFSGAGIGEYFLESIGMHISIANELIIKRGELYKSQYPTSQMIIGDIREKKIFNKIVTSANDRREEFFLIASPPCQGISIAGKNRSQNEYVEDERNFLIFRVIEIINTLHPSFVLIENVPHLLKMLLPFKDKITNVVEILHSLFSSTYNIEAEIINSADFGVPQTRNRAIIKLYKKGYSWPWPPREKKITVYDTIGDLPSLESGEKSAIKWHFARKHNPRHILWMKHTPTGRTAYHNQDYYPQHIDGSRIKGYESCYRRIRWDSPSPTITIRSDAISSQRNVHPGRLISNGTYSDARVLTPLEIMRLNSLPDDWNIPDETSELLIRQCIGESVPPLLIKKIMQGLIKK